LHRILTVTARHPTPPTRFGRTTPAQAKGDYKLVVGAYLHQGPDAAGLPPALAGHAFVGIERPDGRREAFGFSPDGYSGMNLRRDFAKLTAGVPGKVHSDGQAFSKPGVRIASVPISAGQARAALAKVAEYRHRDFSATRSQCTTFAGDVAKAAGVALGPVAPNQPQAFYQALQRRDGIVQGKFIAPLARSAANGAIQRKGGAVALPGSFSLPSGRGQPLPDTLREKMEGFFKTDFSGVRVHVGPEAPAIGALAFTVGDTIVFAPGQYNPSSPQGQQILGHELAHVVQQRQGRVRNPFGSGLAVVNDPGLEAEADRLGMRAAFSR
jgi:hypothetical protein